MKRLATLIIMATMFIVSARAEDECSASKPSCEPRSTLALQYLRSIFGDSDAALTVWINNDYGVEGKRRLERRENRLEHLATWALTLNKADREAYLGAINFYEDGAKEAYAEWHTHDLQRVQAKYSEDLKRCAEVAARSAASHPLPKPPQTETQP